MSDKVIELEEAVKTLHDECNNFKHCPDGCYFYNAEGRYCYLIHKKPFEWNKENENE